MTKEKEPELTQDEIINQLIKTADKEHGKGTLIWGNSDVRLQGVEFVSTGSLGLDITMSGGWARGRITEIFGPESCLSGESFLQYEIWQGDYRVNHKGGTIRRLYDRFHNTYTEGEPKQGRHLQINKGINFYVKSVDDEGRILRNLVLDVIHTGNKPCYEVHTETGQILRCTLEHKFMTPIGFIPLSDLELGSEVFVHNNIRVEGRKKYEYRPTTCVKYHPSFPTKIVHCNKSNHDYLYYRGQNNRIAYEASLNQMTFEQYINALNTWPKSKIETLWFLPENIQVHHINENFTDNRIENLQLVDPSEHGSLHAKDRIRNLSFIATPSKITKISLIGELDTYDLRCEYPYNNYIAEGIVVHNSGKTTLALHAVASFQKAGYICAFIDVEHALDGLYATKLGVNMEKLLFSQPDNAEQALEVIDLLTRSGQIGLIVVDSVAALVPKAELEGDMGQSHMGLQARLMSQALRKLSGIVFKNNTTILFINQMRMKFVMFGSPETTSGGQALKFYASQRLDIRRKDILSQGDDKYGVTSRIKVVKNKVGRPFKECLVDIEFDKGINEIKDFIRVSVDAGIIEKSGSWYSYKDNKLGQGEAKVIETFEQNTPLYQEIKHLLLVKLGFEE